MPQSSARQNEYNESLNEVLIFHNMRYLKGSLKNVEF